MTTIAQFTYAATERAPPLRAPYNFVPLNAKVLPSPWADGPDLATPHPEGLCGEIAVEWRVETPLLVGGRDNNSPFRLGAGGPHAIPGASLRGMIRAVMEILSFAHLDLYDDQRFAVRDYDAVTWQKVQAEATGRRVRIAGPFTGWLKKAGDAYQLTACEQAEIEITDLCMALGISRTDNCSDWHCMSLHRRHAAIDAAGLSGVIDLGRVSASLVGQRGTLVVAGLVKSEVERRARGRAGQPTNKQKEVAYLDPSPGPSWTISAAAFEAFAAVQVTDGRRAIGAPVENWSYWLPKLMANDAVPVFYRGDPATAASGVPKPSEFVMALTRLMRVPHSFTTKDIIDRTQTAGLPLAKLDFVQALFGYVPTKDVNVSQRKGRLRAWRSRVRFSIATLAGGRATVMGPRPAVTMKPRASFYPFYLRPKPPPANVQHPIDWSSEESLLAGRKRYPARNAARGVLPRAPGNPPNPEQENELRFLDASPEDPLLFRSTIRFHNVLPAELGGLLWAIGLRLPGSLENRRLRHMLGRAKGFGYGQVEAVILERDPATWIERNAGGTVPSLADCAEEFEAWVKDGLGRAEDFRAMPEVAALLAMCDANLGASLGNALSFPQHGTSATEAERILAAYSAIKKTSACRRNNQHDDWRGGQIISRDPTEANFLFLPDYPFRL